MAESPQLADTDIAAAQRGLWDELRPAVEAAAALLLAALMTGAVRLRTQDRPAQVLCGANLDPGSRV